MNTDTAAAKNAHLWSKDALQAKAQRYAEVMLEHPRDDWQFGLQSTFVLEFLGRAALGNISPTLLAESKSWNNLYFALGFEPTIKKFIPKSINISEVFSRLQTIIPEFTIELEGFAAQHINRRNGELHAGDTPFDGIGTDWLPLYYETCDVLLQSMGESLDLLLGSSEAKAATKLILAFRDKSTNMVMKSIKDHETAWGIKEDTECTTLTSQALTWATRQAGHRVTCPACANKALVTGSPISVPLQRLEDGLIIETQEYLPSKFECVACQLKISGLPQLTACGLGGTFNSTSTFDATEYYAPEDAYDGYEDDNNEY